MNKKQLSKVKIMIKHSVQQGSLEWKKLRFTSNTASELPAVLGLSKNTSRTELLTLKKLGTDKEFSDYVQKFILDKGHEIEENARVFAEDFLEEELYPVTASNQFDNLNLLASYDGMTLMEDIIWECKSLNEENKHLVQQNIVPECNRMQLEQQLMISGAEKALFTVSDGTKENTFHCWYESDKEYRNKIIPGWQQFLEDLKTFEIPEPEVIHKEQTIEALPSLSIQVKGEVLSSNLEQYKTTALDFIKSISTDLDSDEDFFNADKTVKWLAESEKKLNTQKENILGQTGSIDDVLNTIDFVKEEMRQKRLSLDKLVKQQKKQKKINMVQNAQNQIIEFISNINQELSIVNLPPAVYDFNSVIKGKSKFSSMQDAIDTEIANLKIEINETATLIRSNLKTIADKASNYRFLFNDLQQIITKPNDDFEAQVTLRIAQHQEAEKTKEEARKQAEQARIEAEKKRLEEEHQRKLEVERERIRFEEERKANEAVEEARQESIREEIAKEKAVNNQTSQVSAFKQQVQENLVNDFQPELPQMSFGGDVLFIDSSQVALEGDFSKRDLLHIAGAMMEEKAA